MKLKILQLHELAIIPKYAHEYDAGLDLFSIDEIEITPGESQLIHTGISIELPAKTEAQIRPRSGLALKHQITVLNAPGTIDEGYRGEIGVILINHGQTSFKVTKGMKIAQMVIAPVIRVEIEEVKMLSSSSRGDNGFGSTGISQEIPRLNTVLILSSNSTFSMENTPDNYEPPQRPTWDEYFLMLAKLAATRSTCLAFPVGAVITKNRQVLATGYNGSPSGSAHCTTQGFCYPGLSSCDASKTLPSRAVHAEANAIAQAAKHGISTAGASIYVTLEPCIYCLKLIIAAGIREVFYETTFNSDEKADLRDTFISEGIVELKQIHLSEATAKKAALLLLNPTSVPKNVV